MHTLVQEFAMEQAETETEVAVVEEAEHTM